MIITGELFLRLEDSGSLLQEDIVQRIEILVLRRNGECSVQKSI
jgi:hypothetical protein